MNLQELLQLLDKLRAVGANRFKNADIEVDLSKEIPLTINLPTEKAKPNTAAINQSTSQSAYNADATRKMRELIDTLQMKDTELANTLFPEGA